MDEQGAAGSPPAPPTPCGPGPPQGITATGKFMLAFLESNETDQAEVTVCKTGYHHSLGDVTVTDLF